MFGAEVMARLTQKILPAEISKRSLKDFDV
jgi:hypothetical protein